MMSKDYLPTRPYKGTRDFYPDDMSYRNWYFSKIKKIVNNYSFEEYNGPLLEPFEIYAAKSGEEIVNEQLYSFNDKANRMMVIRPEMTPTAARMVAAKLEQLVFPLKWFSIANFMRYEKPQKGRLREHWQANVDIFGTKSIKAELEILNIVKDLMVEFGANSSMFKIKINNRRFFNDILINTLEADELNLKTIAKAVDKKSKITNEAYEQWLINSGIQKEKIELLEKIFKLNLDDLALMIKGNSQGLKDLKDLFILINESFLNDYCEFDFSIVRGFDYYTGTVFEVYDTSPENKRSLFGGGRYDNLVGLFKDTDISGIGFGVGDVTFQDFLETHNIISTDIQKNEKVLITRFNDVPYKEYLNLSNELRASNIANSIYLDDDEKLGKQLTYAERKGYMLVIIMGLDELETKKITIKDLHSKKQYTIERKEYIKETRRLLQRTEDVIK